MPPALSLGLAVAGAIVLVLLARVAIAASVAARVERAAAATCAFERNDTLAFRVQLAMAALEVALLLRDALSTRRRSPEALGAAPGPPIVVLDGATRGWAARRLARRLAAEGRDVTILSLGAPRVAVDDRIAALAGALACVRAPLDIVAYDVDGLVARALVRLRGRGLGVRHLVTLGTPHQGTRGWPSRPSEQRPGSPLLAHLGANDPVPGTVDATAIYSADEHDVVPCTNGYWAGAMNAEIRGIGHRALLTSPKVHELIREALELTEPSPSMMALQDTEA